MRNLAFEVAAPRPCVGVVDLDAEMSHTGTGGRCCLRLEG